MLMKINDRSGNQLKKIIHIKKEVFKAEIIDKHLTCLNFIDVIIQDCIHIQIKQLFKFQF